MRGSGLVPPEGVERLEGVWLATVGEVVAAAAAPGGERGVLALLDGDPARAAALLAGLRREALNFGMDPSRPAALPGGLGLRLEGEGRVGASGVEEKGGGHD